MVTCDDKDFAKQNQAAKSLYGSIPKVVVDKSPMSKFKKGMGRKFGITLPKDKNGEEVEEEEEEIK